MLNCEQAANYLDMAIGTLRKMREAGQLPPHSQPTPGRYEWREEDIERFKGLFPRNMKDFNKTS